MGAGPGSGSTMPHMPESPHPSARPSYGVDAPMVPLTMVLAGVGVMIAALLAPWRTRVGRLIRGWIGLQGAASLAQGAIFYHTTIRGKFRVWDRELDALNLNGSERLLDVGCGRGAVLIAAARRLPAGRVDGVDLWRSVDQSGNDSAATWANAAAVGVTDRVRLHTADMTQLPFVDDSFDVVTSALAIHNIPTEEGRRRAVAEALRVLKPGGRLRIADFRYVTDYRDWIGPAATIRDLGAGYWYGGPWARTRMVAATKG